MISHADENLDRVPEVAVFATGDPTDAEEVLHSLRLNELADRADVTVFVDGLVEGEEPPSVASNGDPYGFGSLTVRWATPGATRSEAIVEGLDEVLRHAPYVIALEAEIVVAPAFLTFMRDGLRRFAEDDRVLGVSGFSYPYGGDAPGSYFLRGGHCWAWGTWRRAWALFERDGATLLKRILDEGLVYDFDWGGAEPLTRFLHSSVHGWAGVDPWVLQWLGSATVEGGLTLFPGTSLARHTELDSLLPPLLRNGPMGEGPTGALPGDVAPDEGAERRLREIFLRHRAASSAKVRAYRLIRALLPAALERTLYTRWVRRSLA